jgi:large subunit ribosomal protein LP1
LTSAAGLEIESIWFSLFSKALANVNVLDLINNIGSGKLWSFLQNSIAASLKRLTSMAHFKYDLGPAAAAPAASGASAGAAAAGGAPAPAQEEEKEESDDDMGIGLFD